MYTRFCRDGSISVSSPKLFHSLVNLVHIAACAVTCIFVGSSFAGTYVFFLFACAGHWIVTGQLFGNPLNLKNPYQKKPIKPYEKNLLKPM